MLPAYAPLLRKADEVGRAAITVEKIGCPLLVYSGEDDQMWPGTPMAETSCRVPGPASSTTATRVGELPDLSLVSRRCKTGSSAAVAGPLR